LQIFEFVIQKFYALRKPKTNIQILQQSVLLKYKYVILSYHIPIWLVVSTFNTCFAVRASVQSFVNQIVVSVYQFIACDRLIKDSSVLHSHKQRKM